MSQTSATTRITFPGISSRAWEHPADRTALSALRRLKGFDQILKLLSGMLRERQHCQDLDTAIRVEMKLAGGSRLDKLDSAPFLAQARAYERAGDMRDGLLKLLNLELQTHPFSVLRAAALTTWADTGGYGR